MPAIAAGAALSFARAISEYGSLVLLSGNLPEPHRGRLGARADLHRERRPRRRPPRSATLMLVVALVVIVALDVIQRRVARRG